MSGADLAAVSSKRFPEIPVLFTSGYAGPEIAADARVSSRLRKPYTFATWRPRYGVYSMVYSIKRIAPPLTEVAVAL